MNNLKGLILAGGNGTRLFPITLGTSKQLLPIYDKPMIYYPIANLMSAGIREICLITKPNETDLFKSILGSGHEWGIEISYLVQPSPDGIPQAYILGREFINSQKTILILGDNLLVGHGLGRNLAEQRSKIGAHIFLYEVENPSAYGNVEFDEFGKISRIIEKPQNPKSQFAIPGIYFLDGSAPERASTLKPSKRGELEIVDLLNTYLIEERLSFDTLARGTAWLDTGNVDDLFAASEYVRIIQKRQGAYIACLEEIALRNRWITQSDISKSKMINSNSPYSQYLTRLIENGVV